MEKSMFDQIINDINDGHFCSIFDVEECESFCDANPKLLKSEIDVDKHRWYEISTIVYRVGDWLIGIRGPSQLYSESSSWSDLCVDVVAFECEEVTSITYRKKEAE